MKRFYNFFTQIGTFITSMALVIILLIPFMWYRFYEFNTLFMKWLPIADESKKSTAAVMISLVFIFVTMLFMVNVKRLFKGVSLLLAITAFIINLFFWSLTPEANWWFIVFISAVIAGMDYGLPHLFDSFWKEIGAVADLEVIEDRNEDASILLTAKQDEINRITPLIEEYNTLLEKCRCNSCERTFPSPQSKNAHKCKA